ncbi:repressor LexA [Candidatus Falkowbacteria bacterium HGW-Falkowbacteria-2]|uniref:Repressor LexA n=1 Tax=Candidatus Falkowbacteria bacterium HGW-Falkowbacteria-2 TaxID=2013769 RepID=A0A2N2E3B0_9BACT|nr:MAG: repressor LexA [Candidatus Falkowbacteria bacterium HGW-Falkowbacteria-2]
MMEKYKQQIQGFYRRYRRMPDYSEIMTLVGFKSKNAVFKLINRLQAENFLDKDKKGKLIPRNIYGELKVLGQVEAGFPSPAEEELADTMSLDDFLIKNREATYMLKVSGESMKDAGIMPGDMVLVDRSLAPSDGNIVIAEVDKQWTVKYFRKKGNDIYLEPANKKFPIIRATEELRIAAVVKAVIRKY